MPGYNAVRFNTYSYGVNEDASDNGRLWVRQSDNAIFVASNRGWQPVATAGGAGSSFAGLTVTGTTALQTVTVASLLTLNGTGLQITSARQIMLGSGAAPTTAASTLGQIQLPAHPGSAKIHSTVPTTGTVLLTYDTVNRSIQVNIAGTWFGVPSMEMLP